MTSLALEVTPSDFWHDDGDELRKLKTGEKTSRTAHQKFDKAVYPSELSK